MGGKGTNPLVSIVIVNYNAKEYLESCLNSVLNSDYPNFEVIVIDNGSENGSLKFLEEISKSELSINVIRNEKNLGPSAARNQGIRKAKGKYVAFLDNDTRVHPLWLKEAVKVFESNPKIGACQCKLLIMSNPKRIDYVGDYLSPLGFLIQKADYGEVDDGRYESIETIFAAKSAAMAIRRDIIQEIGLFDEDFFIYVEETDICWRVWLAGYKTVLAPQSIVLHAGGISGKERSTEAKYKSLFHGCKNYISTLIKNLDNYNMFKMVPIHVSCWLAIAFYFMARLDFAGACYILKGIMWNIFNLRTILKKRKMVQKKIRIMSDDTIFREVLKSKKLSYFLIKPKKAFEYLDKIEDS